MGYRLLSQMFLMWLCLSATTGRRRKNSFLCTSSCSQVQRAKTLYGATCSCSKSCLMYNDCCRDSPYKNTGSVNIDQTCMTLNSLGPVSLVSSCPLSLGVWAEACYSGLKTFFPVTSKDTGTSYLNYFCAMCNRDINVTGWPVRLRCYEKGRQTGEATAVELFFSYKSKNNLLRSLSKRNHDSGLFGDCKLYAENDDVTFTKSLELRQCFRGHISECLPSWGNQTTRKLCGSYLDPVYTPNRIYRNVHCAQCNGETNLTRECFLLPTHDNVPNPNNKNFVIPVKNPFLTTTTATPTCPPGQVLHPKRNKACVKKHKMSEVPLLQEYMHQLLKW